MSLYQHIRSKMLAFFQNKVLGYALSAYLLLVSRAEAALGSTEATVVVDLLLSRVAAIIGIAVGVVTFLVQLENWQEKRRKRKQEESNE